MVEFEGDLILGGNFTHAEKQSVNRIVRWDGSAFHPIGNGLVQAPENFAVLNGVLYAQMNLGESLPEGASTLIRWDGYEWHPIALSTGGYLTTIKAIDNRLVVAGNFSSIAGVEAQNIAAFDGVLWSGIGNGLDTTVTAVGAISGTLVAAVTRRFEEVRSYEWAETMAWDGTSWSSWGYAPPIAAVADFETYNGDLYMVGPSDQTDKPLFARLTDVGWDLLDLGINHYALGPGYDLQAYGGRLYAAGWFAFDPSFAYSTPVIYWNGNKWQDTETPFNGHVFALCEFNGDLIAGGPFTRVGTYGAYSVARLHSDNWRPLSNDFDGLGIKGTVLSVLGKDSALVVGGDFKAVGPLAASSIALFKDGIWHPMDPGCLADWSGSSQVEDIIFYQDMFVACASRGEFMGFDGRTGRIAGYNGQQWEILGVNAPAAIRLIEYNSNLYCASGTSVYRLEGTTWTKISPVFGGSYVKSMAVYHGELWVAGSITASQSSSTRVVMRFDGSSWKSMTFPVNAFEIHDMEVYHDQLFLASRSNGFQGGVRNLLRWDGAKWLWIPGSNSFSGFNIWDLEVYGSLLITSGAVRYTDGLDSCKFIAGFDGDTWYPLGTGVDSQYAVTMTPYLGGLVIGGPISLSGNKIAKGLAFWQPDHDADLLLDGNDNCAYRYNPDQADITGDGIGDACCCQGTTGDFNQSGVLDLTDLSFLITILTGSFNETLPCPYETYADGYAGVTLSDLSLLVAYFTQSPRPSLPNCP